MDKKKMIIGGGLLLVLLLVVGFFVFGPKNKSVEDEGDLGPVEEVIPTVDASVDVSLTAATAAAHDVILNASNIPQGTISVDYELSYQTASQGLQGVIGTIDTEGEREFEKKLTLGTCSSGTCVYHEVVGKIKLTLKFSGDYGEKLFEKEFGI